MSPKNALAIVSSEYGWPRGTKCVALEKRSTTVMMTDLPPTLGSPSMKSMDTSDGPHSSGNRQGLEEAAWVELLGLVPLADQAVADVVLDDTSCSWCVEVPPKTLQGALNTLMSSIVGCSNGEDGGT